MRNPIITLLTDFGGGDGYVAAMKGVLLDHVPHAVLVDAGHEIPAYDIQAAAWALGQYAFLYPPGTVHVVVVDPGVGTARAGVVAELDGRLFIAPDNGVLHWVRGAAEEVSLGRILDDVHRPGVKSSTFHGRDVFAYVAGRLATRPYAVKEVTEAMDALTAPSWADVRRDGDQVLGEVIHVDRFGNLITNIREVDLEQVGPRPLMIDAGRWSFGALHAAYGDVHPGQPLALIGSHGHVELAVHCGNARELIGLRRGDPVRISAQH